MNFTLPNALSLASVLLVTSAAAFTLDFAMVSPGTPVPGAPDELCLTVPGYGEIRLQSAPGSNLELIDQSGLKAVNFDRFETLVVTFPRRPVDKDPDFPPTGLSPGEVFALQGTAPSVYEVTFSGTNAAVTAIHFVPEPSMLLFVASGLLALIRRR